MRMYDIIENKRNGGSLSDEEISFFINGVCDGSIPDYQISALLMAIYFNGMDERETCTLTMEMAQSGEMLCLSEINGIKADKHSTGGVGDKTTLIVAPIAAALGIKIAKMSGRGLGHTGGTIDKLESIPGFKTELAREDFIRQVNKTGIAVIAQSGNLTPADKKLYALRDVTATVDSIPLIASSVMSKKLAAGSDIIVLDVKTGSGAFMKTPEQSEALAKEMVKIGKNAGRKTVALITDMSTPLGKCIGNSLEVQESVEVLRGQGPEDLTELCFTLVANMLGAAYGMDHDNALIHVKEVIRNGAALNKLKEMVSAQGGDVSYIDDLTKFKRASFSLSVKARQSGYIYETDAEKIGVSASILGAGRTKLGDKINFAAGIVLNKKTGDAVYEGEEIATLLSDNEHSLAEAEKMFLSAVKISGKKPQQPPLIYKVIN